MKIKEINRTANISWSPANRHPTYISVATAGQQLDATFSTTSSLELFQVDFTDCSQDIGVSKMIDIDSRLHKLLWSSSSNEMLIGGAESGKLYIWSVDKIFDQNQQRDALLHKLDKHTGVVAALDINAFQPNLLASGGGDSEIYIWDLLHLDAPLVPGEKSMPLTDVSCLSWNRQVKNILASSHAGTCIIWDLRKNEHITKIRDNSSKIKCNQICWHPDVATQLCLASEDDHSPFLQIWDLRSATAPIRQLESHERGILSMAWCPHDSDLLLSCGKDNRIIVWNPNMESKSGEIVYELPMSSQWCFDVQWSPRHPGIISCASFDGRVGIYSLMGGQPSTEKTSSKVAGAFGSDQLMKPIPHSTFELPVETTLKTAPKWMKKPCGANFGFGGKLVTFSNTKQPSGNNSADVFMLQLVTEPEFVERSNILDAALTTGKLMEFCELKTTQSSDKHEADVWKFLKGNFSENPRIEYLKLLGHDGTNTDSLMSSNGINGHQENNLQLDQLKNKFSKLDTDHNKPLKFNLDSDWSGDVTRALLIGDFEGAVDACLREGKYVEALLIANSAGEKLIHKTQMQILNANDSDLNQLIKGIIFGDFKSLVLNCDLKNWKEMLALILTYTTSHDLLNLSNLLGERLKSSDDKEIIISADFCHIVSGNINELVHNWSHQTPIHNSPLALQSLIEKVMVLKKVLGTPQRLQNEVSAEMNIVKPLIEYGKLLGEQGCMASALKYLHGIDDNIVNFLKDRCYISLGQPSWAPAPTKPFQIMTLNFPNQQRQQLGQRQSQPNVHAHLQQHQHTENTHARSRTNSANYYQPENVRQSYGNVYNEQTSTVRTTIPAYPTGVNAYPTVPYPGSVNPQQNPSFLPNPTEPQISSHYLPNPPHAQVGNSYLANKPHEQVANNFNLGTGANVNQPGLALSSIKGPLAKYSQSANSKLYTQNTEQIMPPVQSNELSYPSVNNGNVGTGFQMGNVVPSVPKTMSAWNDPPFTLPSKQPKVENKLPAFDGVLYNPQDYQPAAASITSVPTMQHKTPTQPTYTPQFQTIVTENRTIPENDKVVIDILTKLAQLCLQTHSNNPAIKKKKVPTATLR